MAKELEFYESLETPISKYRFSLPWAFMEWDAELSFQFPAEYIGTMIEYKSYDALAAKQGNLDRLIISFDHRLIELLEFIKSPFISYNSGKIEDLSHFCGLDFTTESGEKLSLCACNLCQGGDIKTIKKLNKHGDLFVEIIYNDYMNSILDKMFPDEKINKNSYFCSTKLKKLYEVYDES